MLQCTYQGLHFEAISCWFITGIAVALLFKWKHTKLWWVISQFELYTHSVDGQSGIETECGRQSQDSNCYFSAPKIDYPCLGNVLPCSWWNGKLPEVKGKLEPGTPLLFLCFPSVQIGGLRQATAVRRRWMGLVNGPETERMGEQERGGGREMYDSPHRLRQSDRWGDYRAGRLSTVVKVRETSCHVEFPILILLVRNRKHSPFHYNISFNGSGTRFHYQAILQILLSICWKETFFFFQNLETFFSSYQPVHVHWEPWVDNLFGVSEFTGKTHPYRYILSSEFHPSPTQAQCILKRHIHQICQDSCIHLKCIIAVMEHLGECMCPECMFNWEHAYACTYIWVHV